MIGDNQDGFALIDSVDNFVCHLRGNVHANERKHCGGDVEECAGHRDDQTVETEDDGADIH